MRSRVGISKKIAAVFLCFCVALAVCGTSLASSGGGILTDEQLTDKSAVIGAFNSAVNSIKTLKPSFKYSSSYGMDEDSMKDLESSSMAVTLELLVAAVMGDLDIDSAFAGTVSPGSTLGSGNRNFTVGKGQNVNDVIPVVGKSYVSALDADDEFDFKASYNRRTGNTVITLSLPSVSRSDAAGTSLSKVFDLLDAEAIVRFNQNSKYALRIDYFTVDYVSPQVEALINSEGRLVRYTTVLNYRVGFNVSSMGIVGIASSVASAIMGIVQDAGGDLDLTNFYDAMGGMGGMFTGQSTLCTYRRIISLTNFDWFAKMYGDIDNNYVVEAADARLALRAALDIDQITGEMDYIGADVDFDGLVTASDARLILRVALAIDPMFSPETDGWVPGSGIIPEPDDEDFDPDDYDPADLDPADITDFEIGLRSTAPPEEDVSVEETTAEEPTAPTEPVTDPSVPDVPSAPETTTEKRGYTLRDETTKSGTESAGEVLSQVFDFLDFLIPTTAPAEE
ncbi:MAG: hypothetical protein K6C36_01180 [Clostridia bacterium]|nr:hypothetical protein [Clostridia bacterium]